MQALTQNLKIHELRALCSVLLLFVMTSGVLAQETVPDENFEILNKEDMKKASADPDKSTTFGLNVVGSDANIHGMTVGRGGGNLYANSAFGLTALISNTTGDGNTAIGGLTLTYNTTGMTNVATGYGALYYNITGSYNNAFGFTALHKNTSGSSNTAIGIGALFSNPDRSNLVAVGDYALYNNGLNATTSDQATANTALGSKALYANTTGYHNTATGFQALLSNTSGSYSTATGSYALYHNTTGSYNTAYGRNALRHLTAGQENVAFGDNAGINYTGISRGTFLGSEAKPSFNDLSNITGIGYNATPTASNQVRIGNTSVTSIGGSVDWTKFSDGGYKNNVEEDVAGLDFILKLRPVSYNLDVHKLASDLGEDLTRDEDGSKATAVPDEITQRSRDEKAAIRYTGFIAQEVEATVNDLGVAFSGVDAPMNKSGYYGLRYADFVVPLVKAVQEQQEQIEALSPEAMDALREEVSELRQANEQLLAAEVSLREENEVLSQRQSLLEAENESISGQVKDILSMLETLGVDMQDCCQQQTTGRNSGTSSLNQMPDNARLEQNTPNPFHENTLIRYFLPEGTNRAQLLITDMAGLQVMAFLLEQQGAGQVLIHGGTLPSGTYVYTLTIDGRKVDSKRMVLL